MITKAHYMKHVGQLQYKLRIALSLSLLIVIIVVNNFSSRRNMDAINDSVTSIYKDRLMASTYILDLTNNLYEKNSQKRSEILSSAENSYNNTIQTLIEQYEKTKLTKEEGLCWKAFKTNLAAYETSNKQSCFWAAITNLKELSAIQASEGNHLASHARVNISSSAMGSYLEISMAMMIGVFALTLIGLSKNSVSSFQQNPSLN